MGGKVADKLFENRMRELEARGEYGKGASDFLSLAERSELMSIRFPSAPTLWGGYEGAERVIALFGYTEPDIACIRISPRDEKFSSEPSHRDVLGAVLGLGIDRRMTGDILIKDKTAYLFCKRAIAEFISEVLVSVGRNKVRCEALDSIPEGIEKRYEKKELIVASLRLDSIVSAVYALSRADGKEAVEKELVFVNGSVKKDPAYTPSEGDIISVRGKGKFSYNSQYSTTKHGKCKITVDLFI